MGRHPEVRVPVESFRGRHAGTVVPGPGTGHGPGASHVVFAAKCLQHLGQAAERDAAGGGVVCRAQPLQEQERRAGTVSAEQYPASTRYAGSRG